MIFAMVLGGLRRCEVLGLRLKDLWAGEHRVFVVDGKGGHQRIVSMSDTFFTAVGDYIELERPPGCSTDRVFVVLKGQRRGRPLSAAGLDEIFSRGSPARRARSRLVSSVATHLSDSVA